MFASLSPPLKPKGGILRVIGVARISTINQDERSLDDQEQLYRRWLRDNYPGRTKLRMLATQVSGERLDDEQLEKLKKLIRSGRHDLVLCEDLGRIVRRIDVIKVCELAEDNRTRLIAINDSIDTGCEDWRDKSVITAWKHESYNRDTARRIRRTQRNRFANGGMIRLPSYGYLLEPGGKHESQASKEPAAEAVFSEWFERLEEGATFAEISDWLKAENVPLSGGTRAKRWTSSLVSEITYNPILKGLRVRNKKISVRVNETGRRRTQKAPPEERLERRCPWLAFIEPDRYDKVVHMLRSRNGKFAAKTASDPRKKRPKKYSHWPGQQILCGICGRPYVWGGHGQNTHLMCQGAKDYVCWNSLSIDGRLARQRFTELVMSELHRLPAIWDVLHSRLEQQTLSIQTKADLDGDALNTRIAKRVAERDRLIVFIADGTPHASLREKLDSVEADIRELQAQKLHSQETRTRPTLPPLDEFQEQLRRVIEKQDTQPRLFGRTLRLIFKSIIVLPYQCIDGQRCVLRATAKIVLPHTLKSLSASPELLLRSHEVDLFDPPSRIKWRTDVMQRRKVGMRLRDIAKDLDIHFPDVQRAIKLAKMMAALGTSDPYRRIYEPPATNKKMKRHLHKRYEFKPLFDRTAEDAA
jgi:DNA invertase Pin-like site-specific DNA recombinase